MITLHPSILEKEGKKEFAVLPFDEFLQVQQLIEDFEDIQELREAKAKEVSEPGLGFSAVRKQWGLS